MEQHPSSAAKTVPVYLNVDLFHKVLTRYMDKPRDILNFCLANKKVRDLYIDTLYRHTTRDGGCYALEWAAERDDRDLMSTILGVARMEEFAPKAVWHKVLSIAQEQDNMRVAELLFEKQHVQTSIELAAASKAGRRVRRGELYLAHVGVDLYSPDNLTALHYAAGRGHFDLAKFLLEEHGANPNLDNNLSSNGPIQAAVVCGHPRLVELLLSKGADPRCYNSSYNHSFMQAVERRVDESIVKLFLQDGRIDPRAQYLNGRAVLECAIQCNRDGVLHEPTEKRANLNTLLQDERVELSARDRDGCNACTLAAKHGNLGNIRALLLDTRINPDQGDKDGKTPAMYAAAGYLEEGERSIQAYLAQDKHLVLAALIADERVDLSKRDKDGRTAMHWAVENNRLENVKLLLESGRVDVNQEIQTLIETEMTKLLPDSGSIDLSNNNSDVETSLANTTREFEQLLREAVQRAEAAEKERREERQRAEAAEKALQEERQRTQASEELFRLATFEEFLTGCHNFLLSTLNAINADPTRFSKGCATNPRNKWCPQNLRPWSDFMHQQRLTFGMLNDRFPIESRILDNRNLLAGLGNRLPYRPVDPVRVIVDKLREVQEVRAAFEMGDGIDFQNHVHILGDVSSEVLERELPKPPRTPNHRLDLDQLRPDQICVVRADGASLTERAMMYVSEYKSPFKLTVEHLRAGLRPMDMLKEVVNRKTIRLHIRQQGHGLYVPVLLGAIDLRSMDKMYYYCHRVPGNPRRGRTCREHGLVHKDVRPDHVLFNREVDGVMVIDFERTSLLEPPRPPLAAQTVANERKRKPEETAPKDLAVSSRRRRKAR
ncbi:ankyrin repeat-containing domain protein [Trichoderma pleuroticola]